MSAGSLQRKVEPAYVIRTARKTDLVRVVELSELHAEFERSRLPGPSAVSREQRELAMEELLLGTDPPMECLVIEIAERLEGYATFGKQYSTWHARSYLYLDCLFLTACVRGLGIGRALMHQIRDRARAEGLDEIQWQTPSFNHEAIAFYQRLGASPKAKQRFFWSVNDDDQN